MSAFFHVSRRGFLRHGVVAAAGGVLAPSLRAAVRSGKAEPSDTVRLAIIGMGSRGKYLIRDLPESARVVAICDCHEDRMRETLRPPGEFANLLRRFCERDAPHCATVQDYRKLLDRPKAFDAVIIATPDHQHVLPAMLACQAGLDVYLEKALTLTIAEGRALVNAVGKTKRILQVGSQQRSMEMNRFSCDFIRRGGLGRISRVDLPNHPGPMPMAALPEEAVSKGLAWDLFCGSTPLLPYNRRLWEKDVFKVDGVLWRGWDVWRNYSGHLMTNWGAHSADMVQLALGMDHTGPVEIRPDTGGKPVEPRSRPVTMRYADGVELRFTPEARGWVFHGERGQLIMPRNQFKVDPPDLVRDGPGPEAARIWNGPGHVAGPHVKNWIECIKTRKEPNAPVEAGHRSATICHLANIARELGRPLRWNPETEAFAGDAEADALRDRPRRPGFELPAM
ncbi:MAG: gfo/Idh/MocA family oxidoreductase [Lentisphaerae bacterium]|nr:gfo/Idh/MocA family oxidoreductase [Lentisphaerota bacterium]